VYDAARDAMRVTSAFTGGGPSFATSGTAPVRGTINAGASMTYMWTSDWAVSGNYDYDVNSQFSGHNGTLRATARF
jgi:uncharacterized protein with beta-barrel porin domain